MMINDTFQFYCNHNDRITCKNLFIIYKTRSRKDNIKNNALLKIQNLLKYTTLKIQMHANEIPKGVRVSEIIYLRVKMDINAQRTHKQDKRGKRY